MTGRYALGIDVGSTSVSAAIARPGEGDRATLSTVPLGKTAEAMPSLVYVDDAGDLLTGEDAARAGADRRRRHPHGRARRRLVLHPVDRHEQLPHQLGARRLCERSRHLVFQSRQTECHHLAEHSSKA